MNTPSPDSLHLSQFADARESTAAIGTWLVNASHELVASPNFWALIGIDPAKTPTFSSFLGCIRLDERPAVEDALRSESEKISVQYHIIRADNGILRQMLLTGVKAEHARGGSVLTGIIQDVTPAETHVESILKPDFSETLIDASPDRVIALSLDLSIVAWNKTAALYHKKDKKEVLGTNFFAMFPHLKENDIIEEAISHAKGGRTFFIPADTAVYEGSMYEGHFIPLKDENGHTTGILNIIHNVAHRVKAEQKLKALNASLEERNTDLKQKNAELVSFAHVTSHDLKEPLRKASMFANMIVADQATQFSAQGLFYFERLKASLILMEHLTDDILRFAEISPEHLQTSVIDLNHLLNFAKNSLRQKIEVTDAIIEADELPVIIGYRNLISQLFENILDNALKFTLPGVKPHVVVSSGYASKADIPYIGRGNDSGYLRIDFKDNGIGFEPQYGELIFQMFQRLHHSNEYMGTGIGLALCRKITGIHHGFIFAESQVGRGSTFSILLPREGEHPPEVFDERSRSALFLHKS